MPMPGVIESIKLIEASEQKTFLDSVNPIFRSIRSTLHPKVIVGRPGNRLAQGDPMLSKLVGKALSAAVTSRAKLAKS